MIHGSHLRVLKHAFKHGLTEEEIKFAWEHSFIRRSRPWPEQNRIVAIGFNKNHDPIELIAEVHPGLILIIHALKPPTNKVMRELGLNRR